VAFYADDFTGATDTLATVAGAGLRALLFLRPPTDAQLAAAGPLDCLGIAGAARAMDNTAQRAELEGIADYLARLRVPVVHYKTCSTFDSSPAIGSIGLAARILRERLTEVPGQVQGQGQGQGQGQHHFVAIIGGQPNLGRYCVFGNLFAAFQAGNTASGTPGEAYRLDRHPTMSIHPVTPMHEADLLRHLAAQGLVRTAAIQYPAYAPPGPPNPNRDLWQAEAPASDPGVLSPPGGRPASSSPLQPGQTDPAGSALDLAVQHAIEAGPDGVLFDVGAPEHLPIIGRILWKHACQAPLLAIGPSSIEQALIAWWKQSGTLPPALGAGPLHDHAHRQAEPGQEKTVVCPRFSRDWGVSTAVLVFSGSLSPRTARQIEAATAYHHIAVPVDLLLAAAGNPEAESRSLATIRAAIIQHLAAGEHVLAHLVDGQTRKDPAKARPSPDSESRPSNPQPSNPQPSIAHDPAALARASGRFLAGIQQKIRPARLGLAGGDTSSHGVQSLPVWGLSYLAPIDPGAALCRLHADDPRLDGLEVMLKGGQMGSDTIFQKLIPA
jgi:uncharacterized protein YgbK (DUF1537 family)